MSNEVNQRYSTNEKAIFEVYGRRNTVTATLKNISKTGACLTWAQDNVRLETGDLVCVTVELNGLNKKHKVNAEVIWRRENETGISFIPKEVLVEKFVTKTRSPVF